jgi:hypothetical protein
MVFIDLGTDLRAKHIVSPDIESVYGQSLLMLGDCRRFGFTGHFREQLRPTRLVSDLHHRDGSRLSIEVDLASRDSGTEVSVRLAGQLSVEVPSLPASGGTDTGPAAARMLTGDIGRALTGQGLPAALKVIDLRSALYACHHESARRSSGSRPSGSSVTPGFAAYPGPMASPGFSAYPGPMLRAEE